MSVLTITGIVAAPLSLIWLGCMLYDPTATVMPVVAEARKATVHTTWEVDEP